MKEKRQARATNAGRIQSTLADAITPVPSPVPNRNSSTPLPPIPDDSAPTHLVAPPRAVPSTSPHEPRTPGDTGPHGATTKRILKSAQPATLNANPDGHRTAGKRGRLAGGASRRPPSPAELRLREEGIRTTFIPDVSIPRPRMVLDLTDMTAFLMSPAPRGLIVQCCIERFKGLYPRFDVFLEEPRRFLMSARLRKKSKSVNFLVSMNEQDLARASLNYLGKIRAGFFSNDYVAYDKGENPATVDRDRASGLAARQEMAHIAFGASKTPPRSIRVILPAVRPDGSRVICRPFEEHESLIHRASEDPELIVLENKVPVLDPVTNQYRMDFHGRVTQPSVKNFQLIRARDPGADVLLQFGRTGKNNFTLDFSFPLCPFQAFAIAVAALHKKTA
ncbi:putative Tubby protein [Paratrimastix pyriformis]|uniref:Tubby protein n=1 Tax=Paratrimastix pyriformis TaxID=342808 RepID=A0ABQ8UF63_9EUKA|nr:putative Tubby protein [Paratrimastix pyriformis]